MASFEFVVILLAVILVSAILDQVIPRVSLPLLQILLGVVVALVASGPVHFSIDPELFLALFIAPLLFDESRNASKRSLMNNVHDIVSLAIGLVLATVLVVGFCLHWLLPSIPLAAAFALGAALGPTDAVATSALSDSIKLDSRQKALLSGEALINDASGVVSFQFAVAALVTGAFSLAEAGGSFAVSFLGGLAFGVAAGVVALVLLHIVRVIGLESTTFFVMFEVLIPFAVFLAAETLGVSGILAVVAAGLVITLLPEPESASRARRNIVSGGVWETLSFVLNGTVFMLLGMQLPQAVLPSWRGTTDSGMLVVLTLVLTFATVLVRFLWLYVLEVRFRRKVETDTEFAARHVADAEAVKGGNGAAKEALVTALAGPKGAVSMSVMLTFPLVGSADESFSYRPDLLFITSGVIVCTLLLANFVVPLLAPDERGADEEEAGARARAEVFRNVIAELEENTTPDNVYATMRVCENYRSRLRELELSSQTEFERAICRLKNRVLNVQERELGLLRDAGEISEKNARVLANLLSGRRELVNRAQFGRVRGKRISQVKNLFRRRKSSDRPTRPDSASLQELNAARERLDEVGMSYLESQAEDATGMDARVVEEVIDQYRRRVLVTDAVEETKPVEKLDDIKEAERRRRLRRQIAGIRTRAYLIELDCIQSLKEEGRINERTAASMRNDVYLLQMDMADVV